MGTTSKVIGDQKDPENVGFVQWRSVFYVAGDLAHQLLTFLHIDLPSYVAQFRRTSSFCSTDSSDGRRSQSRSPSPSKLRFTPTSIAKRPGSCGMICSTRSDGENRVQPPINPCNGVFSNVRRHSSCSIICELRMIHSLANQNSFVRRVLKYGKPMPQEYSYNEPTRDLPLKIFEAL